MNKASKITLIVVSIIIAAIIIFIISMMIYKKQITTKLNAQSEQPQNQRNINQHIINTGINSNINNTTPNEQMSPMTDDVKNKLIDEIKTHRNDYADVAIQANGFAVKIIFKKYDKDSIISNRIRALGTIKDMSDHVMHISIPFKSEQEAQNFADEINLGVNDRASIEKPTEQVQQHKPNDIGKYGNQHRRFNNNLDFERYIEENNLQCINHRTFKGRSLVYKEENEAKYLLFNLFKDSQRYDGLNRELKHAKHNHALLSQTTLNNEQKSIFDLLDDDDYYRKDNFIFDKNNQVARFGKKRNGLKGSQFTQKADIEKAKKILLEMAKEDIDAVHRQGISFAQIQDPYSHFEGRLVIRDMINSFLFAEINNPNQNPIKKAVIDYILEKEKNMPNGFTMNNKGVSCCNCYGELQTIIMEYIGEGMSNIPIKLLEQFPDVDPFELDKHNKNALTFVIAKGRKNTTGNEGYNDYHSDQRPLFDAILKHKDIARGINIKNKDGNTALHIACARGEKFYIERLIKAGADINITNNAGQTPGDILKLTKDQRQKIVNSVYWGENSNDEIANKAEINDLNAVKTNMVYKDSEDSSLQLHQ